MHPEVKGIGRKPKIYKMNPEIFISPEEWDIIESYLDVPDTPERENSWNAKLSSIPDSAKKIEHVKKIRKQIERSIRKSKIKEFHTHISKEENTKSEGGVSEKNKNSKLLWYALAAIFVGLFGIFWMMDRTPAEKIFAENFKPDIGLPLKMGTPNNVGFYEGMVEYKQGNYKNAIAQWKVLWKDNPKNDTLNYFLGVANLAQGNAKKSLEYLENQERFHQTIFNEDAAYYAALAKIKEGKFEEAKMFLKNNSSDRNTKLLQVLQAL